MDSVGRMDSNGLGYRKACGGFGRTYHMIHEIDIQGGNLWVSVLHPRTCPVAEPWFGVCGKRSEKQQCAQGIKN